MAFVNGLIYHTVRMIILLIYVAGMCKNFRSKPELLLFRHVCAFLDPKMIKLININVIMLYSNIKFRDLFLCAQRCHTYI